MKPIKKIFAIIAAAFLAMSFTACGEGGSASSADADSLETSSTEELQGEALMTAGVVSDTQLEADVGPLASNYNAPAQFKRALEYYKAIDVDVLFFLGDIVNNAQQSSYDLYNSIMDEVFPDKSARPEILFNVGNHERFVGVSGKPNNDKEFTDKQFTENTGEELRAHKKIKGYSFITIDTNVYDSNDCITRGSLNYLEKEAASAAEEADGKPIFVGIHPPVAGTTYGSFGNSDGSKFPDRRYFAAVSQRDSVYGALPLSLGGREEYLSKGIYRGQYGFLFLLLSGCEKRGGKDSEQRGDQI